MDQVSLTPPLPVIPLPRTDAHAHTHTHQRSSKKERHCATLHSSDYLVRVGRGMRQMRLSKHPGGLGKQIAGLAPECGPGPPLGASLASDFPVQLDDLRAPEELQGAWHFDGFPAPAFEEFGSLLGFLKSGPCVKATCRLWACLLTSTGLLFSGRNCYIR